MKRRRNLSPPPLLLLAAAFLLAALGRSSLVCEAFAPPAPARMAPRPLALAPSDGRRRCGAFFAVRQTEEDKELEEEARLKLLEGRRSQVRAWLRSAESLRNYRLANGIVPELDPETGRPVASDSKGALTLTAFVVAAGAVVLRVGGRAALVSTLGLDFAKDNPDLQDGVNQILSFADSLGLAGEAAAFVLAWTAVKVLCFDAGGVVLALASGVLFGGVLQGAFMSAFAATVGSSIAFGLAKVDSPVRNKALELVDEYPSLRGIERVVAKDGLKAILTLRLAPVLPIPIGLYNYVYGVTNVPFFDFAGGIFLGSFKPYLLDSYLGVFSMSIVDGSINNPDGLQDIILLVALGISVLIGVFASQLAGETWETVTEEIEAEKKLREAADSEEGQDAGEDDDGIVREVFGAKLPQWAVGFQLTMRAADARMDELVKVEHQAGVWNCTEAEGGPPREEDPAWFPDSPEVLNAGKGFNPGEAVCDGIALTPVLFMSYFKYADPLYDGFEEEAEELRELGQLRSQGEAIGAAEQLEKPAPAVAVAAAVPAAIAAAAVDEGGRSAAIDALSEEVYVQELLQQMRRITELRLREANEALQKQETRITEFE